MSVHQLSRWPGWCLDTVQYQMGLSAASTPTREEEDPGLEALVTLLVLQKLRHNPSSGEGTSGNCCDFLQTRQVFPITALPPGAMKEVWGEGGQDLYVVGRPRNQDRKRCGGRVVGKDRPKATQLALELWAQSCCDTHSTRTQTPVSECPVRPGVKIKRLGLSPGFLRAVSPSF